MILACAHDGAVYDEGLISTHGFNLESRDIKEVKIYDSNTGEKTENTETIFNFVGFVSNIENNLLVVFPKKYSIKDKEVDSRLVFECMAKHKQKRPELYIGDEPEIKYDSNYPFSSFFGVYEYYNTYGLYFENEIFIKPNTGGRISWKETISKSEKYVIGDTLIMYPLYYRKNYHFSNFITECMIFAIDYTISKFGVFIDLQETGCNFPEFDFLGECDYVVNILFQLKQQVFKDNILQLIDNLINFFSKVNIGGDFYLKHYSFSSIWEDMVTDYLCKFFKEVDTSHCVILDKNNPTKLKFQKTTFHTNGANSNQYISPDHYSSDKDVQFVFDAKYYSGIKGMNYKQISYMFMLKDMIDIETGQKKYSRIYSALLLPSEKRSTKIHFTLDQKFGNQPDLCITEEYLDIRDVIEEYLK